jgi:hypothetical protein
VAFYCGGKHMRMLIVGYTKQDAYEELRDYLRNRPYLSIGELFESKQQFVSEADVTIDWVSLKQHIKDGFQYDEVHVSSLALKHMKPSDLEWIQSLTMKV